MARLGLPALAAAVALVIHLLTALRPDGRAPTDGEARLAAAVFAARGGRVGPVALPWTDLLAARQLAAVTALLPGGAGGDGPVWDAARSGALALGAVTVLLTWAVLHRLGCAAGPTALGVALVGVTPPALAAHSAVTAAAVAVPWLLVAALLCWRGAGRRGRVAAVAAGVAALLAVLTAPLVGAVLLAAVACWAADRTRSRDLPAARGVPAAAVLGGAAVGLAVASAGAGPLAGRAAPLLPTPVVAVGLVCGLVAVAAGWRVRWARPLLAPAVLVLAVFAVPGPGRAAAALTGLVLLAAVVAVVVDDVRLPVRARPAAWTAAAVAATVAAAVAVAALPAPRPAPVPAVPAALLAWAHEQDASGAVLHADALDRAELVAGGFPPERVRALGDPTADGDVVLHTPRTGATPVGCADGTRLDAVARWDGGPAELCSARPAVVDPEPEERARRARIGTALAANPGLVLVPAAADLLRRGDVDPRVMIVLTALSGAHTLAVTDFPAGPLEPAATLRRRVLVTTVDGRPAAGDAPSILRPWLDAQNAPFAPSVVRDEPAGMVFGYRDPAPAGLLPD